MIIIIMLSLEFEVRNGSPFVGSFSLSSLIKYRNSFKGARSRYFIATLFIFVNYKL